MKKLISVGMILLSAWVVLAGCARNASPVLTPPGPLATPRVSSGPLATQTAVIPTPAAVQPQDNPTQPPAPIRTAVPDAPVDPADAAAMAQIENGEARLVETGMLMPFYRAKRELRSYQTSTWTYIIDVQTHTIVEILPVQETAASEGGSLDEAALEQIARQFIAKAASGTSLDALYSSHSSQTANYLFRWEDHNARVMEDGMTYPYIQVALNASGQMLNYFNTLVFGE